MLLQSSAVFLMEHALDDCVDDLPPQKDVMPNRTNTEIRYVPLPELAKPAPEYESRIVYASTTSSVASTPQEAIADWKRKFLEVIASNPGAKTLWWRVRPEIEGQMNFMSDKTEWMVYARFALEMP